VVYVDKRGPMAIERGPLANTQKKNLRNEVTPDVDG